MRRRCRTKYVYFIQAGEDGPVKIGSAKNLKSRIHAMQCDNDRVLTIIHLVHGFKIAEHQAHSVFIDQHIRGEWFRFAPEMLTWKFDPHLEVERSAFYHKFHGAKKVARMVARRNATIAKWTAKENDGIRVWRTA